MFDPLICLLGRARRRCAGPFWSVRNISLLDYFFEASKIIGSRCTPNIGSLDLIIFF